ncbi:MAG TPA: hypothetical protein DDW49_00740 [Deltaproteobacteria bacterium]|nr:MAG: hypothetical protein A2048_03445 [Deltaproteobacteria bacterium GWA2_45_12]HBF11910.1 hypothetical protein [Deltaproteobacteria bacterium]
MKPFKLLSFGFIVCILSCTSRFQSQQGPAIVAIVNGMAIKDSDVKLYLQLNRGSLDWAKLDAKQKKNLLEDTVYHLVDTTILVDWAQKNDITLSAEEIATGMNQLKSGYSESDFEQMLQNKTVGDDTWQKIALQHLIVGKILSGIIELNVKVFPGEISTYYKNHRDEFQKKEQVHVRHLVTDSQEKTQELRNKILKGENFAELAIKHSLSPDRSQGGDLGYFERGTYPKEFDDVCFKLKPGEISPVVKSQYGFHIFKLIDKKPAGLTPMAYVQDEIATRILEEKSSTAYQEWFAEIKEKSLITLNLKALKNISLDD